MSINNENKKGNSNRNKILIAWISVIGAIIVALIPILPELIGSKNGVNNTPIPSPAVTQNRTNVPAQPILTHTEIIIITTNPPSSSTQTPTNTPTQTLTNTPTQTPTNTSTQTIDPIPPDVVSYLSFNGNGEDLSEHGNGVILQGVTFTTGRDGRSNSALSFDGVNDYVQLSNESAYDLTTFTIIIWMKLDNLSAENDWVISKGLGFGNFSIHVTGNSSQFWAGYAGYTHVTESGNWSSIASSEPLPIGSFFCLAISVDRNNFKSYINGQVVRQAQNITPPKQNDNPVYIGLGGHNAIDEYFSGIIDEVQFYSRVLSDNEVAQQCE